MTTHKVRKIISEHGNTFARQAGIKLADKPAPLFQLLVLTTLLSARISSDIAVAAAKELFAAGWRTPKAMLESTWQQRVNALGRGHYVRYDESTARALAETAARTLEVYQGDLRRLAAAAEHEPSRLRALLTEFPRIGPTGAEIFCREVQAVWPWLRPYFDKRALAAASRLGLPADPHRLTRTVPGPEHARLAAALIRISLQPKKSTVSAS